MNNIVAIIPARGGSKGIPYKNIKLVGGKPLIAWNIIAAKKSKFIDDVYVSTDDEKISSIALSYGAKIINRPAELARDESSSESALLHAIGQINSEGVFPNEIVFLQCTSPLTTCEDIDNCIQTLYDENADSAFTAKEFFYFIWKQNADMSCVGINHDPRYRPRRQDREKQYEENGAVYVFKTKGFIENKHRFFGKTVLSLMPDSHCLEIDTMNDIRIADKILTELQKDNMRKTDLPEKIDAIVCDFDGVFTDDLVLLNENGIESVKCSRSDGLAVELFKKTGIPLIVLSSEQNKVVRQRCKKLNIKVFNNIGLKQKALKLRQLATAYNYRLENIVYIGNDINDLECFNICGFSMAPATSNQLILDAADFISKKPGGNGALRECLEFIENTIENK